MDVVASATPGGVKAARKICSKLPPPLAVSAALSRAHRALAVAHPATAHLRTFHLAYGASGNGVASAGGDVECLLVTAKKQRHLPVTRLSPRLVYLPRSVLFLRHPLRTCGALPLSTAVSPSGSAG